MSDPQTAIAPDTLFVVACPVCQGQVAALGSLCGCDACCPLCASLFHVPDPALAAAAPAPDATPAAGPVVPAAEATSAPPLPEPVGLAEDWGRVITQLAPTRRDPKPAANSTSDLADFDVHDATSAAPAGGQEITAAPADAGDQMPMVGGTPLDPQASELAFSETVRTIRHGNTVIEIRRLTPEERRVRRFRRNVLMIVVGVSILLATYLLLSGR
ncbi:MAG: hypothetical protein ACKO1M_11030 [Planctomycetota bacterium]